MSLQAKFDQTMSRADNLLREKLRREEAALEAENAAQRRADAIRLTSGGKMDQRAFIALLETKPPMRISQAAADRT